jgi:hypothetical protein
MPKAKSARRHPNAPYWVMMREHEKKILSGALAQAKHPRAAGKLLGIPGSYFRKRCLAHGIDCPVLPGTKRKKPPHVDPLPPTPITEAFLPTARGVAAAHRNLVHAEERHPRNVGVEVYEEPTLDEGE